LTLKKAMKEKRNLEEALGEGNILDTILENMPDGFLAVDKDRKIIRTNQSFVNMWGILPEIIQSKSDERALQSVLDKLVDPDEFLNRVNSLYTNGNEKSCAEEIALKDGRTFERNSIPLIGLDQKSYGRIWYFRDVTERKNLSIIDPLTKLHNRRSFQETINNEIHRANRYKHDLTLLIIDIDHFKRINDTYGHKYGDEVLKKIGKTFIKNTRKSDTVARYGGEEFTIIFPETNLEGAKDKGEIIRLAVRKTHFQPSRGNIEKITISLGTSQYKPNENAHSLIQRADENLYRAKREGRDRQCTDI